jgi:hypothetical protein
MTLNPNSIHYMFDPESVGWIHRRHERGEEILPADLSRVLSANPATGSDPIMVHYLLEQLAGRLKPKRGRKSLEPSRANKLMIAEFAIEERAKEIRAERKGIDRNLLRAELDPSVQAANEIGRWLGLPTGRTLLNLISTRKKKLNVVSEKADNT